MRFNADREPEEVAFPYAGSLLVAHPSLHDLNFKHSVVLLTAHSEAEGSLGVVVNRPLGQTLGEYDVELGESDLADVPLYEGGPVASDKLILVAWKWDPEDSTFKLFFGIDEMKARQILEQDPGFELRGFIGHSGWTGGQLDSEIEQGAWITVALSPAIEEMSGEEVWRAILSRESAEMRLLADEPDDPSLN